MRGDKMASELSLTWDEHQSTLVGVFEKLLEAGALVDCTIAAEGQYLKAHKIILSACSPYFEMLFTEEKEKNPIVVLKDIKFQELRAMIDFIYRGKVKVPEERLGDFVDAAESLQIKGLGVGNRNLNSPELTTTESSAVTRKKEGRVSPVPRKRSRRSHGNNSGDSIRVISPSLEENNTTSSEDVQHQSQMDVPSTSQREVSSPSVVNATDSSSLYPAVECSEEVNVESNEPISFAETSLPATEPIPNPTNVVVKCEPEPMAEVYVPEIECYIEPKSEEVVLQETMLDCGSGDMDQAAGDSQHSSNQYSAFSSALQASTSTSSGRTDNLMLMADAGPSFSTQGAAGECRGEDRGSLPPPAGSPRGRKSRGNRAGGASSKAGRRRVEIFIPEADTTAEDPLRTDNTSVARMVSSQKSPYNLRTQRNSNNSGTESAAVDPLLLTDADMVKHMKTERLEDVTDKASKSLERESKTPTPSDSSLTLTHAGSDRPFDRTRVHRSTDDKLSSVTNNSTAKDQAKILSPNKDVPNASDIVLAPIHRETNFSNSKNQKRLRTILPRPTNMSLAFVHSFEPPCSQSVNETPDIIPSQPPICISQTRTTADGSLTQSHSQSDALADTTRVNQSIEGVLTSSVNVTSADATATNDTSISSPDNVSNVSNAVDDVLIPINRESSSNITQNLQTVRTILPCPTPVSHFFMQSLGPHCYAPLECSTDKTPQPLVCTSQAPTTTDSSLTRFHSESNPHVNMTRATSAVPSVVDQSQIRIASNDSRVVPNTLNTILIPSHRDSSMDNTKNQRKLRAILPRPASTSISVTYFHSIQALQTPLEEATENQQSQTPAFTSHTSIPADISLTWSHAESDPLADTSINRSMDDGLSSSANNTAATDDKNIFNPNNDPITYLHNVMDNTLISNDSDPSSNNPQDSETKRTSLSRSSSESPPLIVDEPIEPPCRAGGSLSPTQQNPSSSGSTNFKPANSSKTPKQSKTELSPSKSTHRRLLNLACQDYDDVDSNLLEETNEPKRFKGLETKESPSAAKRAPKKRFPCPHCGWDFSVAAKLKKHLRTHWRLLNSESYGKVVMMDPPQKKD